MPDQVASFDTVLNEELSELEERRNALFSNAGPHPGQHETAAGNALAFDALGIGLSGGGIRSATFNLGILQGLAAKGLLPYVDYLSTISGGGYIGTWLHSVIRRKSGGNPKLAQAILDPYRVPGEADDDPIAFLRKYSNYLAPKLGLLSADFWVIFTIWVRNMVLNLLILIPFLAAFVAAAVVIAPLAAAGHEGWGKGLGVGAFVLLAIAVLSSGSNLRAIARRQFSTESNIKTAPPILTVPCVLLAAFAVFYCHWDPSMIFFDLAPAWVFFLAALLALLITMQASGGFMGCFRAQHDLKFLVWIHLLWMPALSAAVGTGLIYGVLSLIGGAQRILPVVWGPPLIVLALIATASFHIGLMGADFPDASREWLARIGAILLIANVAWLVFFSLALYGPLGLAWLSLNYGGTAVALIVAWAGSTVFGVGAGTSASTGGSPDEPKTGGILDLAIKVAPPIFVIGLVILIAGAVHYALGAMVSDGYTKSLVQVSSVPAGAPPQPITGVKLVKIVSTTDQNAAMFGAWFQGLKPFVDDYKKVLRSQETRPYAEWLFAAFAAVALFLPLRFNINEFSLHHFYKNRLVRCYLGAGNAKNRKPNRFTGFDPQDDIAIAALHARAEKNPYFGPYPIVGTTLNLNAGSELAQQERKGTSFLFTPRYCGFLPPHSVEDCQAAAEPGSRMDINGYIETGGYFEPGGPMIGTAMAISGAAANPNWGYHTSAPVAFLLTVFNVRLGYWVGNPRVKTRPGLFQGQTPSKRPGPLYGLMWLIWELLGQTTGRSKYVNLSDGGHFENLGLYELVRRRCRYIVIGDGEQDGGLTFESLGGAIRKCRADFGVEIDINVEPIQKAGAHCVVGTITYPDIDPEPPQPLTPGGPVPTDGRARAWLVYFKASLTGDEPEDVKQYHATHADFPQQSTANQFFTESQFESYRRLGLHIVETAFENVDTKGMTPPEEPGMLPPYRCPRKMFQDLAAVWYPASNMDPGLVARIGDSYATLMKRLAGDPDLAFLDAELAGRTSAATASTPSLAAERKAFFFLVELIQLMENVWFEFGLESNTNRDNPKNGGWMAVFQMWANAPSVTKTWQLSRGRYSTLFQQFIDNLQR
jgi:hypothetical protein